MKQAPGYPLPSGELGSDDIVCQLVYLPDRPEYWQAFYAALHYMTTWRAWERDSDKRGKDAASNWREAFELTTECWRMTCLEQLQDDVAEILELLKIAPECCGDTDITDGDRYTDRVVDGEGDVPQNIIDSGYATGVSDWEGFDDYKCMIAHVTIDQIIARLLELAPRVSQYGLIIGGVTTIAMVLATLMTAGGAAIFYGFVASTGAVALLYQLLTEVGLIEGLAEDVEDNRDALVCSIMQADGDVASLAALNDEIDELFNVAEALILKNMNLGPTLKSLYSGRYDQQDIAEMLEAAGYDTGDFECDCAQVGEFYLSWDFDASREEWRLSPSQSDWNAAKQSLRIVYSVGYVYLSVADLRQKAGLDHTWSGGTVTIHRILFRYDTFHDASNNLRMGVGVPFEFNSGYAESIGVWEYVEQVFDPPIEGVWDDLVMIKFFCDNWTGGQHYIDEIRVDFDANIEP